MKDEDKESKKSDEKDETIKKQKEKTNENIRKKRQPMKTSGMRNPSFFQ